MEWYIALIIGAVAIVALVLDEYFYKKGIK